MSQKGQADLGVTEIAFRNGLTAVHMCRVLTENNQAFNQLPGMERLSVPGSNPELPEIGTVNLDKQAIETAVVLCAHNRIGVKQSESSESKEERLLMKAEPKNENT